MYKSILAVVAIAISATVSAQQYQQVYSTESVDFLVDALQLDDNGMVMVGFSNGAGQGGNDAVIIRTSVYGEILWSQSLGGGASDSFKKITQLPNGNLLIAGTTQSVSETGLPDGFLCEMDLDGQVIWTTVLGEASDEQIRDIKVTEDEEIVITGLTSSFNDQGNYDIFVSKLDITGNLLWNKVYGSQQYEVPLGIEVSPEGKIFVWGHTSDDTNNYSAILLKIGGETGELDWTRSFNLAENELAWDIVMTPEGDLLVSGDTNSQGAGLNDIYVIRLNQDGVIQWAKTYGSFSHDHGTNIEYIKNDLFAVVGASSSFGQGGLDFSVLWINDDGVLKYTSAYGGDNKEVAHGVAKTSDDGLAIVGESRSFGQGFYSGLLVKVNQDGRCMCNNAFSSEFEVSNIEFETGSPELQLRGEEMESLSSDFLVSMQNVIGSEVICSDSPLESAPVGSPSHDIGAEIYQRLSLFPNPTAGQVTASLKTIKGTVSHLEVYNLEGKLVYRKDVPGTNATHQISIPDLSTGIFLVRLTTGTKIETKRLIVE
ncbi:T9SS type A sorting domain-containing protein [Sanyastnella coralliicola]|uniref:T9SS type A sorting domain-containing protein n=1 Tax=Sanyastnella coralliicola TaxID=3069118 RepID=UPI0027BA9A92|nr:T9SS type A sorting domain-containing protein [Longitalea sp. SCSIO 12813]